MFFRILPVVTWEKKERKKKKNTLVSQPNELTYSASPKLARNVKVGDLVAPTL